MGATRDGTEASSKHVSAKQSTQRGLAICRFTGLGSCENGGGSRVSGPPQDCQA